MCPMPGPSRLDRAPIDAVDTPQERSVSFAPPHGRSIEPAPIDNRFIGVGPGRTATSSPVRSGQLEHGGPIHIQKGKVQGPALRGETLERVRLLDWLDSKVHGRAVLVIADAGYGKTTLLADFTRRTRLKVLWYRLDDNDRDWVTLLHHLVAAGREHDPGFAPATRQMLDDPRPDGLGREAVMDCFLGELAAMSSAGAVLILDDFHLVDDAVDVKYVAKELVSRAPDRFAVVFASRRAPAISMARLRASADVAQLSTDDLRFDLEETTELFNGTFGRHLEPDVLQDLASRTEGWIASLQMVQAALRDRSPMEIRRFVRGMTGADHELYEYLAEEVVGELAPDLQRFLMETSILRVIAPDLVEAATGCDARTVQRLTGAAERLTLLSRPAGSSRGNSRYHPLVREFLEARLIAHDGTLSVADRHRRVAEAAVTSDWRSAAYHFRAAGDTTRMLEVVGDAMPVIMASGQYSVAEAFVESVDPDLRPAPVDLILSRVEMQQGDYEAAIAASTAVLESKGIDLVERDHALLNLVTLYLNYGDGDSAIAFAQRLETSEDRNLAKIAKASIAMVTGSEADDIDRINRILISMARDQRANRPHHFAVTQYNLASNCVVQDRPDQALDELEPAIDSLEAGSAAIELAAARVLRAQALAMLGRTRESLAAVEQLRESGSEYQEDEVGFGIADLLDSYLDPNAAEVVFGDLAIERCITPAGRRLASLSTARMYIRRRRFEEAHAALARYPSGRPSHLGIESALRLTRAYLAVAEHDADAQDLVDEAIRHSRLQGAHRWRRSAEVLGSLLASSSEMSRRIGLLGRESAQTLTYVCELILPRLHELDEPARQVVMTAASLHRARWRGALRRAVDDGHPSAIFAGAILEEIGEKEDVARLRRLAHANKKRAEASFLGRRLARALAEPVFIEDQGRIRFRIGSREVVGSAVRRKVLALVCFLLARPQMSSTRDQVLEAIWPDLDPEVAVNSLNQTLYFLRRVFEEHYRDDLSPGYVHHDSDVIWLDENLVTSRSVECRRLIRGLPREPSPNDVERLVQLYGGRFALDFEYEEWAAAHRDWLHAAYLEIVERSLLNDLETGHHGRGILVARRALEVDPSAENIEATLLKLYRVTGANSAAAEQYAHYSSVLRDELGIEPPPLESL